MRKNLLIGLIMGSVILATAGCNTVVSGKEKEEIISVKKDKVKELNVELNLGAGELVVSNGAKEWLDGHIIYKVKNLEPKVTYKDQGDKGKIIIEQKNSTVVKIGNFKNEWNLKLSEDIPLDLVVNSGASDTNLDLRGLKLERLDIETGVGNLNVNLGGDWKKSFETNIETGVGSTTVILPSKVGVKIKSNKGIADTNVAGFISKGNGVYVNEAFDDADVILKVNTEIGVGEVNFEIEK